MKKITLLLIITLLLPMSVSGQGVASDLLGRINNLRSSVGVHAYALNASLSAAAQNHAQWMAQSGQISHTQPNGSTPRDRAANAGYASRWVSENVYMGTNASAARAFNWWVNSPIHYRGMTAGHYYDIGIGAASANGQTAYVLVFGNPTTTVRVAPPITVPESDPYNYRDDNTVAGESGQGQSVAAAPPPPSFIVGVDDAGNILHEVQPGDTIGDIVFIYGYDWSDLDRIRDLNSMTQAEARWLAVGTIIKIPPWDATPVPTTEAPPAQGQEQAQPFTAAAQSDNMTPLPTSPLPTETATAGPSPTMPATATADFTPTATSTPDEVAYDMETATAVAATFTPEATSTPELTLDATATQAITAAATQPPTVTSADAVLWEAATITPELTAVELAQADSGGLIAPRTLQPEVVEASDDNTQTILLVVIVVQFVVLVAAGAALMRRGRTA